MELANSLELYHLQIPLIETNLGDQLSPVQNSQNYRKYYPSRNYASRYSDSVYFNNTDFWELSQSILTTPMLATDSTEMSVLTSTSQTPTMTAPQAIPDELPLRLSYWGIVILVIGYLVVFLFGVIGNCCVVTVVLRLPKMRTVTNYFILSLAVADLCVLLFCLLPNLVSNIFVPWVLGSFLCKTVPYIQGLSVCSSIYSLVAISVERCISIQWPFKHQITKENAKPIIVGIWIWSAIVALPWALVFQSGALDQRFPNMDFCFEIWPEEYKNWNTYYFLIGNFFICYLFPLVVILACYLTIWYRVYRRPVPSNCYKKAIELIHQRSKSAVIKMLIVVVLMFALSWLPLYVIQIYVKFFKVTESAGRIIGNVVPIAQWLGTGLNSCINPLIYSFLNMKFRKAFISVVMGGEGKKKKIKIKHKSPTVNILLKRLSTLQYKVDTTVSVNDDSSDSI